MDYVLFAKIDPETGECRGFSSFTSHEHALAHYEGVLPDSVVEVTPEERDKLRDRDWNTGEKLYKVDLARSKKTVGQRPVKSIPIEIDNIGGKEIIGFEEKPESIIVERKKEITDTKRK